MPSEKSKDKKISDTDTSKEEDFYEPIRDALKNVFSKLGDCYLEVTANNISTRLKRVLDDLSLFYVKIDQQRPDIAGFVVENDRREIITVEVKKRIEKIDDIFKARAYAEAFNANYGFIISPEPISEEMKRFLKYRPSVCCRTKGNAIIITQYDIKTNTLEIVREVYDPVIPKPFGSPPFVHYFVAEDHPRVIVKGNKAYWMEEDTDNLVKEGKVSFDFIPMFGARLLLEDGTPAYQRWIKFHKLTEIEREPLWEELKDK